MFVLMMALLEVDPSRETEMQEIFDVRHDQSIRLGALTHDLLKLHEPGEDAGKWLGTMTLRDMAHFEEVSAAQDADAEAQATIAQVLGLDGPARMISMRGAAST